MNYLLKSLRLPLLLMLDHSRFLIISMLTLLSSLKTIGTISSKLFSRCKYPKKDHHSLGISVRLNLPISIIEQLTWSVITSVSNVKTILPLLESPGQNKFRLYFLFFRIKSTSTNSNTSKN